MLDVEATFLEGIIFKDIALGFGYDQEKGERTEDVESFKVTIMDVRTEEKVTIKVPADSEIPEDIMDRKNEPVRFINLLGGRLNNGGNWFKADGIEFGLV
ncbi:hypothetical protein CHH50_19155 [Terribacillus saccharophilus]|nr:hypothetical protein CHH50_19155 [Terribacillus saccharophilus]